MIQKKVTIGLIQTRVLLDPGKNLKNARTLILDAILKGAQIICLPELYRTKYFPQYIGRDCSNLAELIPGESTRTFQKIASEKDIVIIVPVFEKAEGNNFYNTAVVIDSRGIIGSPYRKIHIPQDPGFYEKGYFRPGSEYRIFQTKFGKIAVMICYDQWFPEAARKVAIEGAEIIFYPTAIGYPKLQIPDEGNWQNAWETIQRSHAIANSVHVAAVNRVGTEGDILFFGGSFLCDPFGNIIAKSGDEEEVLIGTADLAQNQALRDSWGFIRNRRPETYKKICSAYGKDAKTRINLGINPSNQGFHMPAEWEPHYGVWMAWPHDRETFPHLNEVEKTYTEFIKGISFSEIVELLVTDLQMQERVTTILAKASVPIDRISFRITDYADVWIRDYGPEFVVNRSTNEVALVNWDFNAWGNKYDSLVKDREIPGIINSWRNLPIYKPGMVLEGGSVEVNGRGTLITTRSCLLNKNRNPELTEWEIDENLCKYLGVSNIIWLNEGIAGDDTDGHIDDIARFTSPSTVLCAFEADKSDENYSVLKENYEIIKNVTDETKNKLSVVKLPMPAAVEWENRRFPASYTNFFIGNSVVIVPVFNDPADSLALKIIGEEFPNRKVVGINCRAMVEGMGTFHCATQQEPITVIK